MSNETEKAIIKAAKNGDPSTLSCLLKEDSSLLHTRDKDGSTPLHCAAWKGHVEAVKLLLAAGADVNCHSTNTHWGTTPLHAAAHGNQAKVAAVLLEHGANPVAKNLNGRTPLEETNVHNATAVAKLLQD